MRLYYFFNLLTGLSIILYTVCLYNTLVELITEKRKFLIDFIQQVNQSTEKSLQMRTSNSNITVKDGSQWLTLVCVIDITLISIVVSIIFIIYSQSCYDYKFTKYCYNPIFISKFYLNRGLRNITAVSGKYWLL